MRLHFYFYTVGAQSIAHGIISDSISKKKLNFQKTFFLQKIKNGKFSSRFLNKISHFLLKQQKILMSPKSCFCFLPRFCLRFFSAAANFCRLKNRILKGLQVPCLHSHLQVVLWGTFFEKNHQQAPTQLREMVHQYTKYSAFRFCCKKAHLE